MKKRYIGMSSSLKCTSIPTLSCPQGKLYCHTIIHISKFAANSVIIRQNKIKDFNVSQKFEKFERCRNHLVGISSISFCFSCSTVDNLFNASVFFSLFSSLGHSTWLWFASPGDRFSAVSKHRKWFTLFFRIVKMDTQVQCWGWGKHHCLLLKLTLNIDKIQNFSFLNRMERTA